MLDRRLIKEFDWVTLLLALALALLGVLGMYSATRGEGSVSPLFLDHLLRLGVGFAAMLLVMAVDYRILDRYAYLFFALCVLLLVAVEVFGRVGMGAQRWLSLGGVRIQPSEFLKIALVLFLARYLGSMKKKAALGVRDVLPTVVVVSAVFVLILRQPDLGTALIVAGIYVIVLFVAGVDSRIYAWLGACFAASAAVMAGLAYFRIFNVLNLLQDYQVRRLKVLFNPELDPLGAGYHINQSKIAIGSGGIAGKGFLQGTQSGLNFLPQQHTDFIFSVIAEEGGFLISLVALSLMFALLIWGLNTSRKAQDKTGSFIALGVVAVLFLHFAINIGMTTGIFPVVGLPLPLMSYGGSSVLTSFVGLGLLMNIRMRRFVFAQDGSLTAG
jgi:rod shape determining protein RodA